MTPWTPAMLNLSFNKPVWGLYRKRAGAYLRANNGMVTFESIDDAQARADQLNQVDQEQNGAAASEGETMKLQDVIDHLEIDAEKLDDIADKMVVRGGIAADSARTTYGKAEGIRIAIAYLEEFQWSETAFLDAWMRGVEIAGTRWFGDGQAVVTADTKWDLEPRYDDIVANLGSLSRGEAAFLVSMYSFYNSTEGGKLLTQLKIGANSPGGLATLMDGRRREVLADLLVSYGGW